MFLDRMIVRFARCLFQGIFAIGAGLARVQFVGLIVVAAMVASLAFAVVIAALQAALCGA